MISVIIPALNEERQITKSFASLIPAAVAGLVREVIVSDGGSSDLTARIADEAGAVLVTGPAGRGGQMRAGAARAKGPWLLFLHADTALEKGWDEEIESFLAHEDAAETAGYFRFALDDHGRRARMLEALVGLRCALFSLPYGDQGLLIHRSLYDQLGGFQDMPLMEDVDFNRRLGRARLIPFRARALTSAHRYRRDGYLRRSLRNLACLTLFFLGAKPAAIARLYG